MHFEVIPSNWYPRNNVHEPTLTQGYFGVYYEYQKYQIGVSNLPVWSGRDSESIEVSWY